MDSKTKNVKSNIDKMLKYNQTSNVSSQFVRFTNFPSCAVHRLFKKERKKYDKKKNQQSVVGNGFLPAHIYLQIMLNKVFIGPSERMSKFIDVLSLLIPSLSPPEK